MSEDGFPTEIWWVTGLRANGWLCTETRYLKLALNWRVKNGTAKGVKVWQYHGPGGDWCDRTGDFLDENGGKKW